MKRLLKIRKRRANKSYNCLGPSGLTVSWGGGLVGGHPSCAKAKVSKSGPADDRAQREEKGLAIPTDMGPRHGPWDGQGLRRVRVVHGLRPTPHL